MKNLPAQVHKCSMAYFGLFQTQGYLLCLQMIRSSAFNSLIPRLFNLYGSFLKLELELTSSLTHLCILLGL